MTKIGCMAFFSNGWNVIDIINYICMFAAFACRYAALFNSAGIAFPPTDEEFVFLSAPANWVKAYKYALGFNSILTFFKILKYLSHIPMFARLVKILSASIEDVCSFMINVFISLLAFAGAFHLTYGNHMFEFATWGESFMTLFRYSFGDWDIPLLQSYQPDIGLVYFMLWSILAICLLLNMFIAIIMESYDKVNQEEEKISMFAFAKAQILGKSTSRGWGVYRADGGGEYRENTYSHTHTRVRARTHSHTYTQAQNGLRQQCGSFTCTGLRGFQIQRGSWTRRTPTSKSSLANKYSRPKSRRMQAALSSFLTRSSLFSRCLPVSE
jgi:hypothetical protein